MENEKRQPAPPPAPPTEYFFHAEAELLEFCVCRGLGDVYK